MIKTKKNSTSREEFDRTRGAITLLSRNQHQLRIELKKVMLQPKTMETNKQARKLRLQLMRNRTGLNGLRHYNKVIRNYYYSM